MHQHRLFSLFGMQVWVTPPALAGFILVWVVASALGWVYFDFTPTELIAGGFVAAALHMVSGLIHHLGHFVAAKQTGYPMVGVVFGRFLIFGTSIYPDDEPKLPGAVHVRRAWGGPIASAAFGILLSIVAALLREEGGLLYWVLIFALFDTLFLYFIGSLVPMRINDGATILTYRAIDKAKRDRGRR